MVTQHPILLGSALAFLVTLSGCTDSSVETEKKRIDNTSVPAMEAVEDTVSIEAPSADDASTEKEGTDLLGPGAPAPPIAIAKWVKGNPVESFAKDKVYVVEFWATWCGPCLRSMPHMAAMQREYGDKVTFIGVSDESEQTVESFMKRPSEEGGTWSEVLTYTIALDDEAKTNAAYMKAANQGGIPCAFVVGKTGNIEWIGHPMSMDQPLSQIVNGTWDSVKAREEFLLEAETERVLNEFMPRLAGAASEEDYPAAVKVCDEILEQLPGNPRVSQIRMTMFMRGDMMKEFNETAAQQVEANFDDAVMLNQVAWTMADGTQNAERDLTIALKAAMRASDLTKHQDASIMDTLARVYYEQGNLPKAIEWQKKAIEADAGMKQLAETLARYEAELIPPKTEEKPVEPATEDAASKEESDTTENPREEAKTE